MPYALGVDLGTTYTAAAIAEDGRTEILPLGTVGASIPSVVVLREDGQVLTGEAAERRSVTEPTRTAREFKRRLGDPAPMVLGGTPYGAEALMARLLRAVVDVASERQGRPPASITVTHPANYGPYKRDLLTEMARLADVGDVTFLTEPEAAAINYAEQDRLAPGEIVAVYDFGGGTFDAAVLRKTADGFELLGTPEGMERLGGIDFDQAVFAHVDDATGGQLDELDTTDPQARAALQRLRADARLAKESLSSDTDTTIPVMLPTVQTQVRLTRPEFEAMIRPRIGETIAALQRAVRSAGIDMSGVSRILLVGGSSRIPLVAEMVRDATGRPVVVDAHPKFTIALGAARHGARQLAGAAPLATSADAPTAPIPVVAAPPSAAAARPARAAAAAAATAPAAVPDREPAAAGEGRRTRAPFAVIAGAVAVLVVAGLAFALLGGGNQGAGPSPTAAATGAAQASASAPSSAAPEPSVAPSASVAPSPTVAGSAEASPSPIASASAPASPGPATPAPEGIVTTFAGAVERGNSGDGGPAAGARFGIIGGLTVLPDGRVVVVDDNEAWRIIDADGIVNRIGAFDEVLGPIAAEADGTVVSVAHFTHQLWRIAPDGTATRVAGRDDGVSGYAGDGGPAELSELNGPDGVAVAPDGTIYVSDTFSERVRAIATDGTIRTVVGAVTPEGPATAGFSGDGGPATEAQLDAPLGLAVAPDGTLYIVDASNYRIRRVTPDGTIDTFAGSGATDAEPLEEGGDALRQGLGSEPRAVATDPAGNVYTVVGGIVVRIRLDQTVNVIAGGGDDIYATDVPPDRVRIATPMGLAFDAEGALLIADGTRILRLAGVAERP